MVCYEIFVFAGRPFQSSEIFLEKTLYSGSPSVEDRSVNKNSPKMRRSSKESVAEAKLRRLKTTFFNHMVSQSRVEPKRRGENRKEERRTSLPKANTLRSMKTTFYPSTTTSSTLEATPYSTDVKEQTTLTATLQVITPSTSSFDASQGSSAHVSPRTVHSTVNGAQEDPDIETYRVSATAIKVSEPKSVDKVTVPVSRMLATNNTEVGDYSVTAISESLPMTNRTKRTSKNLPGNVWISGPVPTSVKFSLPNGTKETKSNSALLSTSGSKSPQTAMRTTTDATARTRASKEVYLSENNTPDKTSTKKTTTAFERPTGR